MRLSSGIHSTSDQGKPTGDDGGNDAPKLPGLSLFGPTFDYEKHQGYVEYLVEAVANGGRNIALAGAYSAGKSSVLVGLKNALHDHRVVEVSLTNLNRSEQELRKAHGEPSLSAVLQKEVVKRLLYSSVPSEVPLSRVDRIRAFQLPQVLQFAVVLAFALLIGYHSLTSADQIAQHFQFPGANIRTWTLQLLGVTSAITLGAWGLKGVRLRELSVGPAKLQLTADDGRYFDAYLDELVYFFQATRTSVVIFEDLDRFNDSGIFQSLRDLNNVLKGTASIKQDIVFIYAIRDSLFDRTKPEAKNGGEDGDKSGDGDDGRRNGEDDGASKATDDAARAGVGSPASDRAKFFDAIVPIVPFISHEVAPDLLRDVLTGIPEDYQPSSDLVALAGRYFTDMRLIHSIRNEYIIFSEALLIKRKIEDLNPDGLFSMVLYKHSQLLDYERIRIGGSRLDQLVSAVSDLTNERLRALDRDIAATSNELITAKTAGQRSTKAGERLLATLETGYRFLRASPTAEGVFLTVAGQQFGRSDVATLAFWKVLADHKGDVQVEFPPLGRSFDFPSKELVRHAGIVEPIEKWLGEDIRVLEARLKKLRDSRQKLISANFKEKVTTEILNGPGENGEQVNMAERSRDLLSDDLALELVLGGYIDNNFALYTTHYYGGYVSFSARSFMLRAIDKNRSEPLFELSNGDVTVLLSQIKTGFLGTPSALNVSVFDALLGDARLQSTLDRIAAGTLDSDSSFVETYLTNGQRPLELLSQLTPNWKRALDVIGQSDLLDGEAKVRFIGTILSSLSPNVTYTISESTRKLISEALDRIPDFAEPLSVPNAKALARFLGGETLRVSHLRRIPDPAKTQLALEGAFEVSRGNLDAITSANDGIGLDSLGDLGEAVRHHVLDEAKQYIEALRATEPPALSLDDPHRMVEVLETVTHLEPELLDEIIELAHEDAILERIQDAPQEVWSQLARNDRVMPTVGNICAYIDSHELSTLDDDLIQLLRNRDAIEGIEASSEPDRLRLATAIVNSTGLATRTKIGLTHSLELDSYLDVSRLTLTSDDLFAELLRHGRIPDTAETFNHLRNLEWGAREQAMVASDELPNFVTDLELSTAELARLVLSPMVPKSAKLALLEEVQLLAGRLNRESATALIEISISEGIEHRSSDILVILEGGAEHVAVARLLGKWGWHLTSNELTDILASLDEPYRKLAAANGTRPRVPDLEEIRSLLDRLTQLGRVSSTGEPSDGLIPVFMKQKAATT